MIRRTILFDNQCGFALGENSRAPNPFVTWRFNEQDGHRDYFWGHYMNEPDMAERDLLNRAEDYQRRYHVQEVEQAPDKETYLYYSTQRPIDIGTYPNSYFNRPVHMDLYFTRQQVTGEAFQAWGAITYAHPLTEREMQDYELLAWGHPGYSAQNRPGENARRPGQCAEARPGYVVRSMRREAAAHKEAKRQPPIAEQLKAAQREAQEHRAPDGPKKKAPDRGDR